MPQVAPTDPDPIPDQEIVIFYTRFVVITVDLPRPAMLRASWS